jgi:hypothetical protein
MVAPAALPAIGTVTGLLTMVTTTLPKLNLQRHSFFKFRRLLRGLQRDVDLCEVLFREWDKTWSMGQFHVASTAPDVGTIVSAQATENDYSNPVYQFLWGEQYNNIRDARLDVKKALDRVDLHLKRAMDDPDRDDPEWRQYAALHRKSVFKRACFAFISEESLRQEIAHLRGALQNLQDLSELRMKAVRGLNPNAADISPTDAHCLQRLLEFSQGLHENLRKLQRASWALELRPPAASQDVETLQNETILRIVFTYKLGSLPKRVEFQYTLGTSIAPLTWSNLGVSGTSWRRNNPKDAHLKCADMQPHVKRTRPFRSLFREQFFAKKKVRKSWESDQAYLLLSLANWALLLWDSEWMTDLCCSGLRFAKLEDRKKGLPGKGPCLHSLTIHSRQGFEHRPPPQRRSTARPEVNSHQERLSLPPTRQPQRRSTYLRPPEQPSRSQAQSQQARRSLQAPPSQPRRQPSQAQRDSPSQQSSSQQSSSRTQRSTPSQLPARPLRRVSAEPQLGQQAERSSQREVQQPQRSAINHQRAEANGQQTSGPSPAHAPTPTHVPASQPQRPQHIEECECSHRGPKLKHLGLTFAEIICAVPIRESRSQSRADLPVYEVWGGDEQGNGNWSSINTLELLESVYDQSKSRQIQDAINHCLTAEVLR